MGKCKWILCWGFFRFYIFIDKNKQYNVNTPIIQYIVIQLMNHFMEMDMIFLINYSFQNNSNYTKGMASPLEIINELIKRVQNYIAKNYEVYQIILDHRL